MSEDSSDDEQKKNKLSWNCSLMVLFGQTILSLCCNHRKNLF